MLIMSLVVGVIITSIELLRESSLDETNMWEKVNAVRNKYDVDSEIIDVILELFDIADQNLNGVLTFAELQPIMVILCRTKTWWHYYYYYKNNKAFQFF